MTIKELKKAYQDIKNWYAYKVYNDGTCCVNYNYNDDDIVISYEIKEIETKDITDALFKKGKIKVNKEPHLIVKWRRK